MKRLIMVAVFLLTIESALGQVVIDQVMYDPIGSESGGEFVLLKNNGGTVDISGWIIMTSSSPADVVIPDGVMLFPGSTYLIADNNWNVSKDDSTWPEADLESTMTMKNSDSGVALVVNGTVIDAVGWGVSTNPLLFEGSPTSGTVPGESLQRINDTEDNAVDFVTGVPVFGVEAQGDISVVVTVLDANVTITNGLMLEDDDASAGIQITPSPGAIRDLPLEITLESNRNVTVQAFFDTESGMLELVNSSDRTKVFSGSVGLPYSTPPGLHNITITGDDGQDVAVYRVEFEVLPLVALDVSVSEINFGSVLAGSSVQ
ncbi:MAG: lamin tail domain-containing protein, partial [Candidatus Nanoarchaeia archaeon]